MKVQEIENITRALGRGKRITIKDGKKNLVFSAAETSNTIDASSIIISATKASIILGKKLKKPVSIKINPKIKKLMPEIIYRNPRIDLNYINASSLEEEALNLTKISELLPVIFTYNLQKTKYKINAKVIDQYEKLEVESLKIVAEAPLNLKWGGKAKIMVFRAEINSKLHYAIIVGSPNKDPLVRIHSSCYTGDLLASLACDCRDQLHEALNYMHNNGGGILLYLMQEGRGIGIVNKLRTYALQAEGHDTVEANEILGFDGDERSFLLASKLLKILKIKSIRMLTNNPRKVEELETTGIKIKERIPLVVSHEHNERYLKTKSAKLRHIIP